MVGMFIVGISAPSCSQEAEGYLRPHPITTLDAVMKETSGLALSDGQLLTHNDRGGDNVLYAIDTIDGSVARKVRITGAVNVDWEDLAMGDSLLFIGDMGNNNGDRTDLRIYTVERGCVVSGAAECPVRDTIRFHFPEQTDFTHGKEHNFDCEAIAYHIGSIYLFTKHRTDANTVAYRLPAIGGDHPAERLGTFAAGGRITGADIFTDSDGRTVAALVGYNKKAACFLWLLDGTPDSGFLDGQRTRHLLGPYRELGQMEAVVDDGTGGLFLSSEKTKDVPPMLYRLPLAGK